MAREPARDSNQPTLASQKGVGLFAILGPHINYEQTCDEGLCHMETANTSVGCDF